jgi:F-type H+-transporting ATPase subunit alpha
VLANSGDITAYLPTNIMSITDGQLILDMDIFRDGVRPAISSGLSVSRVGGRGHNDRQKSQFSRVLQSLASYREAAEFSHFGSELALEARKELETGKRIFEVLTQAPGEFYNVMSQQLLLEAVLSAEEGTVLDIDSMKKSVAEVGKDVGEDDEKFKAALKELVSKGLIEMKK